MFQVIAVDNGITAKTSKPMTESRALALARVWMAQGFYVKFRAA